MLTLFTHFNAVCGQKVQLLLHELSLAHTLHPVNIRDSEQYSAWFLKLNPKGEVPILVDDTDAICESKDICFYLDEKFNACQLSPISTKQNKKIRQWLNFIEGDLNDACVLLSWCIAIRPEMQKKSEHEIKQHLNSIPNEKKQLERTKILKLGLNVPEMVTAMSHYQLLLTKMARLLAKTDYLYSNKLTLADIITLPYIERLSLFSYHDMWQEYPEIGLWHQRMKALKGYETCFQDSYPPYFKERWAEYGLLAKEKVISLKTDS